MSPWIDLFRRPAKPKADGRLRWFGKLPTYEDYYKSAVDEDWAVEFNDWILKGYEIYDEQLSSVSAHRSQPREKQHAERRLPAGGLILQLPASGMTVLASLADYGGDMRGRPFPLCFYVGVPTAQWPGPGSLHVAGALEIVSQLMNLRHDVARFFKTPSRFETVFADRQISLEAIERPASEEAWFKQARDLPLDAWFSGTTMAADDTLPAWIRKLYALEDCIARAAGGEDLSLSLYLPLAACVPPAVQVGGWLRWLESRVSLPAQNLSLLLTGTSETELARLAIIAREPVTEDFLLLSSLWSTLSYVDWPRPTEPASSAAGSGPNGVPHNRRDPEMLASWADLVAPPTSPRGDVRLTGDPIPAK